MIRNSLFIIFSVNEVSKTMLLINKPPGPTSHDIVDEVRKITGEQRVGHTGTLDPFAEGLLIVLVGREKTRLQSKFLGLDKTYEAVLILGSETDTHDLTGKPIKSKFLSPLEVSRRKTIINYQLSNPKRKPSVSYGADPIPVLCGASGSRIPNKKQVKQILKKFEGEQAQVPPEYSAKKIDGKKAYEIARRGKRVRLKPKNIKIFYIKLLKYQYPELLIRTKVSSGTYVRALARDIGRKLETGAYVKELKRTEIGKYKLKNAKTLESLYKNNMYDKKQ
jgi:tRNA pseudouridine55 synthase